MQETKTKQLTTVFALPPKDVYRTFQGRQWQSQKSRPATMCMLYKPTRDAGQLLSRHERPATIIIIIIIIAIIPTITQMLI
jgi:hypothetical protein